MDALLSYKDDSTHNIQDTATAYKFVVDFDLLNLKEVFKLPASSYSSWVQRHS